MSTTKLQLGILSALLVISVITSVVLQHHAGVRLREQERAVQQQTAQLAQLAAENARLSNLIAQAKSAPALSVEQFTELLRLRGQVGLLRKELEDLAGSKPAAPKGGSTLKLPVPVGQPYNSWVVSDSDSGDYALQLAKLAAGESNRYTGDARNLTWALREYARQHDGQFPLTFAEAEPYKWKGDRPLAGSFKDRDTMAGINDFEIVYQGTLNELTNAGGVALIRQRAPWQTPNGKWARVYTMVNTLVYAVESDDDFKTWEAEHVISPIGAP